MKAEKWAFQKAVDSVLPWAELWDTLVVDIMVVKLEKGMDELKVRYWVLKMAHWKGILYN
jgi:hypothetical protein